MLNKYQYYYHHHHHPHPIPILILLAMPLGVDGKRNPYIYFPLVFTFFLSGYKWKACF